MKYTIDDIRQMQEGQTFDCKSFQIQPKALANTIVAMANADGGMIAIGISDGQRKIEGVDQNKKHLNDILRTPFDFCVPSVTVTTEYMPCVDVKGNNNHILLMFIPASATLHANQADEVFWRVGDKSHKLSFEERVQLLYDKGERYFEDTPAFNASLDDIDMLAVQDYTNLIGYGKTALEFLQENKGFVSFKDGVPQISTACILLFGKRPQNFFPRARVRFIRFLGTEEKVGREMNVVKDVTFEGRILEQIKKAIAYLETQVKEHSYLGDTGTFVTDREYPKFVLQEMVVNSVCHRDYSIKGTEIQIKMFDDRLVFETPGKLPGIVRTDNIRHTHFSRNPKIAEYLKAYDFVKEFGEGVDRMCRELSAIGSLEPQYLLIAFILKTTVFASIDKRYNTTQNNDHSTQTKDYTTQKSEITTQNNNSTQRGVFRLTFSQRGIIDCILENPKINRVEIASKLGNITENGVKYNLKALKKKGLIKRVGSDFGGHWEVINYPDLP
ncbi:MAG: putative DNA binding domain-containing protein [Prevotella sp.]|nr:putative DNA binding domain-containing protein [Prevotella sp.]